MDNKKISFGSMVFQVLGFLSSIVTIWLAYNSGNPQFQYLSGWIVTTCLWITYLISMFYAYRTNNMLVRENISLTEKNTALEADKMILTQRNQHLETIQIYLVQRDTAFNQNTATPQQLTTRE